MTGNPADHPAVVNPQVVTATNQVLAAPVLAAPAVVAGQPAVPPANTSMDLLRKLFPDGSMSLVEVKKMGDNPNPIATQSFGEPGKEGQYDGWTQSETLIYMSEDTFDTWEVYPACVLVHEAEHVRQFKRGGGRPANFEAMMRFEVGAYTRTWQWMDTKGRTTLTKIGLDITSKDPVYAPPNDTPEKYYNSLVESFKNHALAVNAMYAATLARRVGRVLERTANGLLAPLAGGGQLAPANTQQTNAELYFKNMVDNHMIPPPGSVPDVNGNMVPQRYTSADMYLQPEDRGMGSFTARMAGIGFPIWP